MTFRRTGRDARITVDGFHTDFKTADGSNSLELDGNLYVGGLGPPFSEIPIPAGLWTAVLQQGFVGCFKDLVMNNEAVDVAGYAREQDSGKSSRRSRSIFNPYVEVTYIFSALFFSLFAETKFNFPHGISFFK